MGPIGVVLRIFSAVSVLLIAYCPIVGADAEFCAKAQSLIAQTSVPVQNTLHNSYDLFVESRASASPLVTQQFYSNPVPGKGGVHSVVSCKMKTRRSILDAYPAPPDEPAVRSEDRSCDFVTREMLASLRQSIPSDQLQLASHAVVVDEEKLTFMGPMWLNPWPFQPAYRDLAGVVHLKSRAMYVPWSIFIPVPAAFKGIYYCHMVTPAYLQALLRGDLEAPL